jgi:CRP/FNR family cyclic AMP-dependent transcriptional regulator
MSTNALLPVVETHPFVAGLDPRHVGRLAEMAREMCFDKGVVIFPEGDHGREFYLLVNGMVALEINTHGILHRIQTLYKGDEFGWSAVLAGKHKVLQARALDRVDVLVFDGEELADAFRDDTAFGLAIAMRLLGVVSERLTAARVQLLDLYAPESKRAGT